MEAGRKEGRRDGSRAHPSTCQTTGSPLGLSSPGAPAAEVPAVWALRPLPGFLCQLGLPLEPAGGWPRWTVTVPAAPRFLHRPAGPHGRHGGDERRESSAHTDTGHSELEEALAVVSPQDTSPACPRRLAEGP